MRAMLPLLAVTALQIGCGAAAPEPASRPAPREAAQPQAQPLPQQKACSPATAQTADYRALAVHLREMARTNADELRAAVAAGSDDSVVVELRIVVDSNNGAIIASATAERPEGQTADVSSTLGLPGNSDYSLPGDAECEFRFTMTLPAEAD